MSKNGEIVGMVVEGNHVLLWKVSRSFIELKFVLSEPLDIRWKLEASFTEFFVVINVSI